MGPDLAAGKAAAFLSVTALFMSPVLIPPTWEESRSFCALHTPLFPWPLGLQVGLVLGGLAHRHTPCELTVTQTRKTTDTSYPIISVTPLLTSLLLPKFLFFLFFFFSIPELFPCSSLPASPHAYPCPWEALHWAWIPPCVSHPCPPHTAPIHHFFLIVPLKF